MMLLLLSDVSLTKPCLFVFVCVRKHVNDIKDFLRTRKLYFSASLENNSYSSVTLNTSFEESGTYLEYNLFFHSA